MRRLLVIGLIISMMLTGSVFALENVTVSGGTETELRELLARVLGGYGSPVQETEILVANVPEEAADIAIVPEDAVLIGSVRRSGADMFGPGIGGGTGALIEIFINGGNPEANYQTILNELSALNGMELIRSDLNNPGGFNPSISGYATLCQQSMDRSVNFDTSMMASGETITTIRMQSPIDAYMCTKDGQTSEVIDPMRDVIPSLTPPTGVSIDQATSSGITFYGPQMFGISAHLLTDLAVDDVAAGYHEQLAAAGWMQALEDGGERTSVTNWTITDEKGDEWLGTFTLQPWPGDPTGFMATIAVVPTN
ncbi:MAG: hypothetical protein KC615_06095 [Anaerolineae bacterium]|nr:hypothetical protein [Anaerolineae bacterium]